MTNQSFANAATPISEKDLNSKIMKLLQTDKSCPDARFIMLYLTQDETPADNWRIGHFDPGNGDRYQCKLALRAIAASLSGQYHMVGES